VIVTLGVLTGALLALTPSFHLVLSDGNDQLKGQLNATAEKVAESFREVGIEMTWSFDPSDPSLPAWNVVKVIVLPRSSRDWGMNPGILAAVRRSSGSEALVVVFYKEVERFLTTHSIQGPNAPGRRPVNAVARVIVHEVLHYFLPDRPHDPDGVFKDHVGGNLLARSSFEIRPETREALVAKLLEVRADREADSTR
jgi:hypothetical protein